MKTHVYLGYKNLKYITGPSPILESGQAKILQEHRVQRHW